MTPKAREYAAVIAEGRAAQPGEANPHRGDVVRANLWRRGYDAMILERFYTSRAGRAYLAGPLSGV